MTTTGAGAARGVELPRHVPEPPSGCKTPGCGRGGLSVEPHCPSCGASRGAPNVLMASLHQEQNALGHRVMTAVEDAQRRGCYQQLMAFAQALHTSRAVVNVTPLFARSFLENDRQLYAAYSGLVMSQARLPAAPEHDQRRTAIDGHLFGSHAADLRYAALSLDGDGLTSYGPVSLVLKDAAVRDRASVLEENAYQFVRRHGQIAGNVPPAGYRAPWLNRDHVAVAKLAARFDAATTPGQFARLLLLPGVRGDDEFVEVVIYLGFDRGAVDEIRVPARGSNAVHATDVELLVSTARRLGIPVVES